MGAWVLVYLVVIFVVFIIVIAKEVARWKRIEEAWKFNPPNAHGASRFANNKDLRRAGLFKRKGIPIGYSPDGRRAMRYSGSGHLLTIAAARMGKGATLIINVLLSLRRSVICIDPKGENAAVTGHARARFGKVFVLNPFGMLPDALKGLKQAHVNPMDILDAASNAFHAGCDKLAAALVWDEGREGMHFTTAARMLVSGVIAALIRHGAASEKNLPTVAKIISADICRFCRLIVQSTTDPFIIQKLGRFAAPGAETIREVTDVIATAITQLGFIGNAAIAECLRGSDFRFKDLAKSRIVTVYISLPLTMLDACSKFFRLILETAIWDLLNERQRGAGKPVLAIVDEMAQLGPDMKSLENAMGMASGAAGLQIWSILQDLSQLKGMFPSTWETFIQNCGVTTWFGGRDHTTREYVSKLSGICEVLNQAKSVSIDIRTGEPQANHSATQCARPLLLPHEVGQIASDEMIAFIEGVRCGPVKAKRKFYFKVFSGYRPNPYVRNSGVGFLRRLFGW